MKIKLIIAALYAGTWLGYEAPAAEFKFDNHKIIVPDGFEVG